MKIITIIILSLLMITAIGCIDKKPLVYTDPDVVFSSSRDVTEFYPDYINLENGWYDFPTPQYKVNYVVIKEGVHRKLYITDVNETLEIQGAGYALGNEQENTIDILTNGTTKIYEISIWVHRVKDSGSHFTIKGVNPIHRVVFRTP